MRQARLVQVWQECREAALAPENAEPRVVLRQEDLAVLEDKPKAAPLCPVHT